MSELMLLYIDSCASIVLCHCTNYDCFVSSVSCTKTDSEDTELAKQ